MGGNKSGVTSFEVLISLTPVNVYRAYPASPRSINPSPESQLMRFHGDYNIADGDVDVNVASAKRVRCLQVL